MLARSPLNLLFVLHQASDHAAALKGFFTSMAHVQVTSLAQLPTDLSGYHAVVTAGDPLDHHAVDRLGGHVRDGHGWLMLVSPEHNDLPQVCGAALTPADPAVELRVLFQQPDHPLGHRLPDAVYVPGWHRRLIPADDQTEVILYADWQYDHSPMLVRRQVGAGHLAVTTLQNFDHPVLQKILYRLVYQMASAFASDEDLGVGILGYAPSVGQLHGLGATATQGLSLKAACDLDPQRLEQARTDFGEISLHPSADALAADDAVQLVIVATPPNSHANLALNMLDAGKHVVCEKPLALTREEADRMAELAARRQLLLCCHQNRRFDPDYLAIKKAVSQGHIGDIFHMETFVGGFHHPCGYWHSHAPVSGGTTYDWGAHYLDWIVGLMGRRTIAVQATRHKRVWHDVTNADQESITVRFADGSEALFIHSDIAAVRKPKWYILGTRGAIVGHWQDVTSHIPDDVHYYQAHPIPATEMPPHLLLNRRQAEGAMVRQQMAIPERQAYAFHHNLADHVHWGEPLAAPLKDSIHVVTILEAAARSMAKGGSVEVLNG